MRPELKGCNNPRRRKATRARSTLFGYIDAVHGAGMSDDSMNIANIGGKCGGAYAVFGAASAKLNNALSGLFILGEACQAICSRVFKEYAHLGARACATFPYPQYSQP